MADENRMSHSTPQRELWSSRLGFFLAAVGSAIGLGNVWRFPSITGENGGAAFVLIYLAAVLTVGLPVMIAELALGWRTRESPVRALESLAPKTAWKSVGVLAVVASWAIVSYYSVVASWTLAFIFRTITGKFNDIPNAAYVDAQFASVSGDFWSATGYLAAFVAMTTLVIAGGVKKGVERWSKILMPVLFLILILLVIRSLTLPGAAKGLAFYLCPDFSKVSVQTIRDALSQAFFSLSLGMGIMITYGSYLSRESRIGPSALWICLTDTAIAVLAGFVIFPALFTIPGLAPSEGPKLIFLVLPNVFDQIPGGVFFGAGFFGLLTLAALTSSISLMEVVVSYCMDSWRWSRKKSVVAVSLATFLLGLPSAWAAGAVPTLSELPLVRLSFLDMMDAVFGKFALTVTSLALCLFVGWRWRLAAALGDDVRPAWLYRSAGWLLRYACPILIFAILVGLLI